MLKLGVNIDHVATLRQVRLGLEPEPAFAALVCEAAGADAIVAHLREDRRHIQDRDIYLLKQVVRTKFNLEMSIAPAIVAIACEVKPNQATLVPEKRQELTTEGGLDAVAYFTKISQAFKRLNDSGIETSLFIDPDKKQIDAAIKIGVKMVELSTGRYAEAKNKRDEDKNFRQLTNAVFYAKSKGLKVFAGHGLNYHNVARIAGIKEIEELNIGYAIICRAVIAGLERAVKEMINLI